MNKREYRRIKKLSKEFINRSNKKKLRKIPDILERTEGLKYLIASKLKLEYLDLKHKAGEKKQKSLLLDSKLELLPKKIKILETSHQERDYKVVKKLISEIKREVERCLDS